jgi:hypothetical protein
MYILYQVNNKKLLLQKQTRGEDNMELICPISLMSIEDPVMTLTGQIYERACIIKWFTSNDTDPATGLILPCKTLLTVDLKTDNLEQEIKDRREAIATLSKFGVVVWFMFDSNMKKAQAILKTKKQIENFDVKKTQEWILYQHIFLDYFFYQHKSCPHRNISSILF